ncbi:superoxide dismutase family protein [Streptomyces sp. NPDC006925]|uniref:superoxide dismutase family protein n=1 Tax=Streptomyces sp. NPDC006925 TaxID=3364768 RepID=UPI0036C8CB6D
MRVGMRTAGAVGAAAAAAVALLAGSGTSTAGERAADGVPPRAAAPGGRAGPDGAAHAAPGGAASRRAADGPHGVDGTDSTAHAADRQPFQQPFLVREDQFSPANAFIRPDAITYDQARVPAGAGITVARRATRHGTTVWLRVRGLLPDRTYGAHVHTRPCGGRPGDAGPHYQHRRAPRQPSTDPRYANPRNEVWLDVTTDSAGRGSAVSRHGWTFRPGGAGSVVLHERATRTGQGHAGAAGARLGCFTVPLSGG